METETAVVETVTVEDREAADRRRRLIKFAAIAGGALVGLVVLGKLASSTEDEDEAEDEA